MIGHHIETDDATFAAFERNLIIDRVRSMIADLTPERAREVIDQIHFTSSNNTSITPVDYTSMNGKKVGVTSGTILAELLKHWAKEKKVEFKFVEYEEIAKKEADLYAGKIDLDVELSMLAKRNLSAVEKVGASAYYLVAGRFSFFFSITSYFST